MNFQAISKQVHDMYERQICAPEIIVEPDTSLTFNYGKGSTWNLPNSFLKFRGYQQQVHDAVLNQGKRFVYLAWSRRLGKEVTTWSLLIKYCLLHRCTGVIIYPDSKMGSRILWEGKMSDKASNGSIDFLDFLPPIVDRNKDVNNTVKRIDLPNGSQIWLLGAESFDRLRGINPQIVVESEYAFQDPRAHEAVRPIIAENNGVLIVQTTFDGYNHGYELFEKAKKSTNWFTSFLTAETAIDEQGNRYVSEDEIQQMREEGYPEYKIQQEFYMKVDGDTDKYLFAEAIQHMRNIGNFQKEVWLPGYAVYSCWDIGVNDSNFIILVQVINGKYRIVKDFETNNKSYTYEVELITKWRLERNLSLGCHFLPHDGKNRGKNTREEEAENGVTFISRTLGQPCQAVSKPSTVVYGTRLVRSLLPSCILDEDECAQLVKCLGQAKKDYDSARKCFIDAVRHDWTSHAVKALQTLALAVNEKKITPVKSKPTRYAGG